MSLRDGLQTLVVVSHHRPFEKVFLHYSEVIRLYAKSGKLSIKTIDEVTAEDLESHFVELDKETP